MLYGKYINDLTLSGYAQDYEGIEDYFEQDENTNTADAPVGFYIMTYLRQIMGYAFVFYFWIAASRIRRAIREKHAIPEQNCVGCVVCCGCCKVMQMTRHTSDYDKYPSQCCTET